LRKNPGKAIEKIPTEEYFRGAKKIGLEEKSMRLKYLIPDK